MERVPHGDVPVLGTAQSRYAVNSFSNRILIPEAAGGPRLRYDARPWIIMMASSVHHADNAERNDTLKWSIDEVPLMSFIACKQDPGSHQLTSLRMVPSCGQCGEKDISAGRCWKKC
jgi:hypothetical protein